MVEVGYKYKFFGDDAKVITTHAPRRLLLDGLRRLLRRSLEWFHSMIVTSLSRPFRRTGVTFTSRSIYRLPYQI